MSEQAKVLFEQVMGLPQNERVGLIDALVEADHAPLYSYMEDEWDAELNRRLQAVEDGTAELIDGEQVFRELDEELRRMRGE